MSLSKDALDTITATAIAASGAPLDTHVPAILVPQGFDLKNLEHLQARPSRFRGAFKTYCVAAFVEYVKRHARTNESAGFIGDDITAGVIFDLGDAISPGHGGHTAKLILNPTAPFKAAEEVIDSKRSQQVLSEWLEDWAPYISVVDRDGELIPLPAAIDGIRRMRIETKGARDSDIGDFTAKKSAMEEIEAKSAGRLPGFVRFTCKPYDALDTITMNLRLSVLTGSDDPIFRLRWVNQGIQNEEIIENFRAMLAEKLGDTLPMTIGGFTK